MYQDEVHPRSLQPSDRMLAVSRRAGLLGVGACLRHDWPLLAAPRVGIVQAAALGLQVQHLGRGTHELAFSDERLCGQTAAGKQNESRPGMQRHACARRACLPSEVPRDEQGQRRQVEGPRRLQAQVRTHSDVIVQRLLPQLLSHTERHLCILAQPLS